MLAPRKKLWSSPREVIDEAIALLSPCNSDVVYDVGAGDGNFVAACCAATDCKCIGIEINPDRTLEANLMLRDKFTIAFDSGRCVIICENALEVDYSEATAFYLYLVPHGLRRMLTIIKKIPRRNIRVVTYMSPFEDIDPIQIKHVSPVNHPDAKWPLYFYIFDNISNENK